MVVGELWWSIGYLQDVFYFPACEPENLIAEQEERSSLPGAAGYNLS